MKISAFNYYLTSLRTLILKFNWQEIGNFLLGKNKLINVQGFQFKIANFMDLWTLKEVVADDVYQLKNFLTKYPKAKRVMIDIGASIGDCAILAENLGFKKVIAYEMVADRIKLCKENLKLNQCQQVKLMAKAAKSLDEIFQKHQLKKCDFLKIDCEGAEYQILKNAKKSLAKVKQLAMEVHLFDEEMEENFKWLKKTLKANRFQVIVSPNPVHSNICYLFAYNKALR